MMNDVPAYLEGALSFRPGDLDPPRRAKQLLLRLWNAYWDRQARRATAVMLYALSDRTLADIGVDRSEIESLRLSSRKPRSGYPGSIAPTGAVS
jgi:uncharacterized protein YjiS (DUF1127 family)